LDPQESAPHPNGISISYAVLQGMSVYRQTDRPCCMRHLATSMQCMQCGLKTESGLNAANAKQLPSDFQDPSET